MTSLKKRAALSAGRARCSKCRFWLNSTCISPDVAQVCFENYIKGYIKGYNQRKKEEQQ